VFTLDRVLPWGRSFEEYCRMFAVTDADLQRHILGCGDGPASFNAEAARRGGHVVSCDPLYRFERTAIEERIEATFDEVIEQTRRNAHEFVWGPEIRDVEELGRIRMAAMQAFLADFDRGKAAGRYVDAELPVLPFPDDTFDLALCSHLLFLYSRQLGETFHRAALVELCRVAPEVRVFPLLALGGEPSPFVESGGRTLREAGFEVSIETVRYEFQRGGNQMMRILRGGNGLFAAERDHRVDSGGASRGDIRGKE
jgi:hypothetical protein